MKIILDLDTGIDDALALAYALGHEDCELIAITSVFGNVETDQATHNASAITKLLGREDIPIFPGARRALGAEVDYVQEKASGIFHGRNGLGRVDLAAGNNIQSQGAVDFIIEAASKYGDELTLVTTGPLTNAALAIQEDLAAMRALKGIVAMGGALTVPGNVSPYAEANFHKDPAANNIVFSSGLPVTVVGLDVTLRTLLTELDIKPWQSGSPAARTFFDFVDYYLHAYEGSYDELAGCALHDPLAVSVALDPTWVSGVNLAIKSLTDSDQRGRLVQDQAALNAGKARNVKVALDIADPQAYKDHFMTSINRALG